MSGRKAIRRDPKLAEQIQAMRQYGTSIEDVSRAVGISVPTLRKLYANELEKGAALANIAVGKKLFERCMAGDAAALIYWTKTRMGWKETQKVDLTSSDGSMSPLPQAIKVVFVDAANGKPKK